jgi:ATP-binding cassette subfamily B protein
MVSSYKIFKLFWSYAWKYPWYVLGVLLLTPLANIFLRLVPPLIVASVINRLTSSDYVKGDVWGSFGQEIVWFTLLIFGGGFLLWRIVIYLIWKLEGFVVRNISRDMFNKMIDLDINFHANNFGGSLVSQTNKLTSAYIRCQDAFVFQIYLMLVAYTFISFAMWDKAPLFVVLMWGFSALFVIVTMFISVKVRKLATLEANAQNKVTGYLADAITNVMTIKSFATSKFESKRFDKQTENSRQKTVNLMWATLWRDTFSSGVTSIITVGALVVSVFAVVNYGANIGLVFLVFTYSADITERLWQFSSTTLRTINRAIGDSREGYKTLHTEPLVKDQQNTDEFNFDKTDIVFENVNFAHHDNEEKALFKNFNLVIEQGTKIGLVGHSGSGKTSLVRLLLRYMDIDSGQILIGGKNISKISQHDLHSSIAFVPQEPMLFHRSLAENIAYGKETATKEQIIEVAKKAHAHEFIKDLPLGYETLVGERGIKLSGGQRQRIAIARAMLKDSPILVLDEATSALDSESETLIQDALKKLMKNKTVIVIAHRLSTIQKMDRIIVLDKGRVIEDGSHKNLLEQNGTYSKLWSHQSGGFLEE